ncbi:MAG: ABC-2 family transporter protein [bacterium]|nr:ABC-2 family transporter protein [bacterium]
MILKYFPLWARRCRGLRIYWRVWRRTAALSFMSGLVSRFGACLLILGKLVRFGFFLVFLAVIGTKTKAIAGYNLSEMVFFFLTFNLVDVLSQFFFREAYRFRPKIISGGFDLTLTKPISPLFQSLLTGADILDLITLPPLILTIILVSGKFGVDFSHVFLYCLLVVNGLLIAASLHVLVLSLGVITTEIDHAMLIYRDIANMGRVPVDIYRQGLREVLTFILPVGIMMSFPAKAFLGVLSWQNTLYGLIFSVVLFYFCLRVWHWSLRKYSSASS